MRESASGSAKPSDSATYERAMRFANQAMWTIDLQHRRLTTAEPEDARFALRKWSDFSFFIVAITRLRRAAELASKIPSIREPVRRSLDLFDGEMPSLRTMRNVAEHFDEYALDAGRDRRISRKSLEVVSSDSRTWCWLDSELNIDQARSAGLKLFKALKAVRGPLLASLNSS